MYSYARIARMVFEQTANMRKRPKTNANNKLNVDDIIYIVYTSETV